MGPRTGLDGGRKISLSAGFDPRTVHPVSSRYSDRAIPVAKSDCVLCCRIKICSGVLYRRKCKWQNQMEKFCQVLRRRERKHCRLEHVDIWNTWVLNFVSRIAGGTYAEGGLGMGFRGRYLDPGGKM